MPGKFCDAHVGIEKVLLSICYFFILSSDLYRRIYPFLLLFDIKYYIYFGAPVSTKFRSILLPHGFRLVRTC